MVYIVSCLSPTPTNESYGNKLFGISGAQATRITPRAQLPFFENKNSLFQICRLNGATHESQLELETGSSESSPPSHAESPARLLPDSAASTPDIFMKGCSLGDELVLADQGLGHGTPPAT